MLKDCIGNQWARNADGSSLARLISTPLNSWDTAPVWRR